MDSNHKCILCTIIYSAVFLHARAHMILTWNLHKQNTRGCSCSSDKIVASGGRRCSRRSSPVTSQQIIIQSLQIIRINFIIKFSNGVVYLLPVLFFRIFDKIIAVVHESRDKATVSHSPKLHSGVSVFSFKLGVPTQTALLMNNISTWEIFLCAHFILIENYARCYFILVTWNM